MLGFPRYFYFLSAVLLWEHCQLFKDWNHQNARRLCEGPTGCLRTAPLTRGEGSVVSCLPAEGAGVEVGEGKW